LYCSDSLTGIRAWSLWEQRQMKRSYETRTLVPVTGTVATTCARFPWKAQCAGRGCVCCKPYTVTHQPALLQQGDFLKVQRGVLCVRMLSVPFITARARVAARENTPLRLVFSMGLYENIVRCKLRRHFSQELVCTIYTTCGYWQRRILTLRIPAYVVNVWAGIVDDYVTDRIQCSVNSVERSTPICLTKRVDWRKCLYVCAGPRNFNTTISVPFCTSRAQLTWQLAGQMDWAWRTARLTPSPDLISYISICGDAWRNEFMSRKRGIMTNALRWLLDIVSRQLISVRGSTYRRCEACAQVERGHFKTLLIMRSTFSVLKRPATRTRSTRKYVVWSDDWNIL
jgi:hypothetical protein